MLSCSVFAELARCTDEVRCGHFKLLPVSQFTLWSGGPEWTRSNIPLSHVNYCCNSYVFSPICKYQLSRSNEYLEGKFNGGFTFASKNLKPSLPLLQWQLWLWLLLPRIERRHQSVSDWSQNREPRDSSSRVRWLPHTAHWRKLHSRHQHRRQHRRASDANRQPCVRTHAIPPDRGRQQFRGESCDRCRTAAVRFVKIHHKCPCWHKYTVRSMINSYFHGFSCYAALGISGSVTCRFLAINEIEPSLSVSSTNYDIVFNIYLDGALFDARIFRMCSSSPQTDIIFASFQWTFTMFL